MVWAPAGVSGDRLVCGCLSWMAERRDAAA
jgi:hypothetical protein